MVGHHLDPAVAAAVQASLGPAVAAAVQATEGQRSRQGVLFPRYNMMVASLEPPTEKLLWDCILIETALKDAPDQQH